MASSVMSPRPRIGLIHQPESHSYCFEAGHLNFVGLLNCAMMREQTRKTPHPEFIEQINGGQTADISGLGAANYNYCPAILLCANSNFLHHQAAPAGEDAGSNALRFLDVHCSCDPSLADGAMSSRNVWLKSGCHDQAGARAQTITLVLRDPPTAWLRS